jgi:hypothetical protein
MALSVVAMLAMRHVVLALVLATVLTLSSCAVSSSDETYKVTMYNGGVAIKEWNGVTSYTRWSDNFIELRIDGESVYVGGGPLVIECEKSDD